MRLRQNILLDQDEFNRASEDLATLRDDLATLRGRIEGMLNSLQEGFNTPAGRDFVRSCRENLLKPMDDQRIVLNQISNVLRESRGKYQSVFNAYRDLNSSISL